MGRASSAKKARLLAGPPSKRRGRLRAWPFALSLIVVAGVGLVWQSTVERSAFVAFGLQLGDHWHAGFGVFDCGVLQPPSINIAHATGFDFHEENIVHLHPASTRATGRRATLNTIGEDVGLHIGVDSITLADGTVRTNGDRCDETKATTQIKVWAAANDSIGRVLTGAERGAYTLQDGEAVSIFFGPPAADVPKPPNLDNSSRD